jgi:short-subunit dehydrogenase
MGVSIITGASGGLGEALTKVLTRHNPGGEYWLLGRNRDELERLKEMIPARARVITMDLSDDDWPEDFSELLEKERPDVEWLINNAGIGYRGPFQKESFSHVLRLTRVDFEAPVLMTSLVLPWMKPGGHILNVCSVAGFFPLPGMALYGAVKSGLLSFTRALYEEQKPRGIFVTALCPYWIGDTHFISRMGGDNTMEPRGARALSVDEIAEKAIRGAAAGKEMVRPGLLSSLAWWGRFLPQAVLMKFRSWWKA